MGTRTLLQSAAGSLPAEVEVTMTPIADLATPVLDGFAGGVHFEPDGLVLAGVAWLEIAGGEPSASGVVGFSYRGDGAEVSLGWAEAGQGVIRVPVTHFSGTGAGQPAPGAAGHPPTGRDEAKRQEPAAAYIANEFYSSRTITPWSNRCPPGTRPGGTRRSNPPSRQPHRTTRC
jgi:hypothetical protein